MVYLEDIKMPQIFKTGNVISSLFNNVKCTADLLIIILMEEHDTLNNEKGIMKHTHTHKQREGDSPCRLFENKSHEIDL